MFCSEQKFQFSPKIREFESETYGVMQSIRAPLHVIDSMRNICGLRKKKGLNHNFTWKVALFSTHPHLEYFLVFQVISRNDPISLANEIHKVLGNSGCYWLFHVKFSGNDQLVKGF